MLKERHQTTFKNRTISKEPVLCSIMVKLLLIDRLREFTNHVVFHVTLQDKRVFGNNVVFHVRLQDK